jgi:hypothetical protein
MADLSAKTADGPAKVNGGGNQYNMSADSEKSPKLHTGKGDVIPLYRSALRHPSWLPLREYLLVCRLTSRWDASYAYAAYMAAKR